jgi:hypothetical protein
MSNQPPFFQLLYVRSAQLSVCFRDPVVFLGFVWPVFCLCMLFILCAASVDCVCVMALP